MVDAGGGQVVAVQRLVDHDRVGPVLERAHQSGGQGPWARPHSYTSNVQNPRQIFCLEDDYASEDFAAAHLGESLLDVGDADGLRDELLQRQPALQVQVGQHREVAVGQAVAVPRRLEPAAAAEHVEQRQLEPHLGGRHADEDHGPGQVPCVERLLVGLNPADRLDHHVGTVALGQFPDRLDRVGAGRVDRVGRAEFTRPAELAVVDVDADDLPCSGEPGAEDGRAADTAAADDRDRVAAADLAGVQGRAETGHHAAAEQPGDLGLDLRVDLGALPGGDQRLGGERADAKRGRQHGAVGERHLLLGVVRGEAVPGPATPTRATLSADRAPVEYDE